MKELTPKTPSEILTYSFDLTDRVTVGDTISSVLWTIEVYRGIDAADLTPMLVGAESHTSLICAHRIGGGLNGVDYYIEAVATMVSGEKVSGSGLLAVRRGA